MKKIGKYTFPIFFVFLLAIGNVKGQKNTAGAGLHEIGAGIGGLNYTGDISPKYNFGNYRPGGILFYRYNLSPVISFRIAGVFGSLAANESKSTDPIPSVRNYKFNSGIGEVATTVEYNFLNYRPKNEVYRYSPYFTAGFCIFNSSNSGGLQIGVPIGVGMKYRLNRRLNLGFEMVARKTWTDKLDGADSILIGVHQTSNPKNKDWYYFTGFTISWTIFSVVCPDIYNGN